MTSASPIRLAVIDDYEVVVNGLAKMLERYRDRVEVAELDIEGRSSMTKDELIEALRDG